MYRRRAGRGVRGVGQLTPEQVWLNANPQCLSGGNVICPYPASVIAAQAALPMSQPSAYSFLPAATQAAAQNPTYSTQITPWTPFTTTTFDLNSYMAQWAAQSASMPAGLGGADPVSEALAVAQSYCATEGVTGCANLNSIASQYGNQVKAAIAGSAAQGAARAAAAVKTSIVTNPGAKTNAVSSNAPAPGPNPATQTQTGNALQPYRYTYSGSVATGSSTLNPANNVNVLPTDTTSNTTSGGGALSTTGTDTSWIWVVAIGAGVVLLMMSSTGAHA